MPRTNPKVVKHPHWSDYPQPVVPPVRDFSKPEQIEARRDESLANVRLKLYPRDLLLLAAVAICGLAMLIFGALVAGLVFAVALTLGLRGK